MAEFTPDLFNLVFYGGDGASFDLTVTNDADEPIELTGAVVAQIRTRRTDPEALANFEVEVPAEEPGIVTLSLTGAQTAELLAAGQQRDGSYFGQWDCEWTPLGGEPITLLHGTVKCAADVTRPGVSP